MPDFFTHMIAAELIYEKLDGEYGKAVTDRPLYLLGAQGGDIFFFYGLSFKNNLGRLLHRAPAAELFDAISKGDRSYAAGWATHYALDSSVHPLVYAYEEAHRGAFIHQRYEKDLGLYVSRKSGLRRTILPREKVIACTPAICDSVKKYVPYVSASGVACCLKRYFAYTRRLFGSKQQEFTLDCDYSAAYAAFQQGCELGVQAVKCVLDGRIDGEVFSKSFLERRA